MAIAPQPPVLSMAWASNSAADKNDIPVTMQVADMSNDGAASWSMGFPSQTSLSQGQGGYYVARQDINGALNTLSQFALFAQSGAVYNWSASVDYGAGAHVRGSDGVEYIALVNNGPDVSSAVNPTTDVNYTTWKPYLRSIADFIYPVGSIYMSVNNTSPAVLFGGVWQRIQGRFLLGSSSSYAVGSTGGAATKTLTVNNLPAHNHVATTADNGGHIHTATNANNGAHTHTVTVDNSGAHTHTTSGTAASAGAHTHTISVTNGAQSAGAHTHGVTYAATTVTATAASAGAHTHGAPASKTTITSSNPSPATHTHTRGTMNIKASGFMGEANENSEQYLGFKEQATGALYYSGTKKWGSKGGIDKDDFMGYFDASREGAWTGHTSSDGTHTHTITINASALTSTSAGAHTHSVSVAIPAKNMTTASAGAHTHNLSGTTASGGAHTHTVSGTAASAGTHNHDASTASAGSHTHTITVQTAGVHQHAVTVNNTGGNTAFSLLPPYFAVNIWQRTA